MPKTIAVFSDGTGNKPGDGNDSNVLQLYRIAQKRTSDQVAFYDRGVGTGSLRLTGLVFARGLSKNILDCYRFIVDEYEENARIFLFGFSRGAFTVRSLGGMISKCGILKRKHKDQIKDAFQLYKGGADEKTTNEFINKYSTQKNDIHFIGVWDTVGAVGAPGWFKRKVIPWHHSFHNTRLGDNVSYAYQALSIDDRRKNVSTSVVGPMDGSP